MLDLSALEAFAPPPKAIRQKKAKPVDRVYRAGKPRGFMALDPHEQEEVALEKYKPLYRLLLQWNHNFKKTRIPAQKAWAADEMDAVQRKLDYWNRYITTEDGITKLCQLVSRIKNNWRMA